MALSFKPKYKIVSQTKINVWHNSKVYKKFFRYKWWFLGLSLRKKKKYRVLRQQKLINAKMLASLTFQDFRYNNIFEKKEEEAIFKNKKRSYFFKKFKSSINGWKGRNAWRKNKRSVLNFKRFNFAKIFLLSKDVSGSTPSFNIPFRKKRRLATLKKSTFKQHLYHLQLIRKSLGKVNKKQFLKMYHKDFKEKKQKTFSFFNFIDSRLDVSVSKVFLNNNIFLARQLILHGFFSVNNSQIVSPSYYLNLGDCVTINGEKHWTFIFNYLLRAYYKSFKSAKRLFLNNNFEVNYSILAFIFLNNGNSRLNDKLNSTELESNLLLK